MILKTPYKFLAKHFKLIHLILFLLSAYLLTKTNLILSFFSEYIESTSLISTLNLQNNLFNRSMFVISIVIIFILLLILIVLKRKQKHIKFYMFNIISYVFILVFYLYLFSASKILESGILDVRIIRMIDDISLIIFIIQIISTFFFLSRTLGFNIKKFNFDKDLKLDYHDDDNEEVEIDINVDTNVFTRTIKRNFRFARYIFRENTLAIIFTIIGLILVGFWGFYYITNVVNKIYKENENFNIDQFKMKVSSSYITDERYDGTKITNNKLVVINLNVLSLGEEKEFNDSKLTFSINHIPFSIANKYSKDLLDIGNIYKRKKISNKKEEKFLLIYEIPSRLVDEDMKLFYNYGNNKRITIDISPKTFNIEEDKTVKIKDKLEINNKLIRKTSLVIDSYEFSKRFKLNYLYKAQDDMYYSSFEYLVPNYIDNYNRVLLKLTGDFSSEQIEFKDFAKYFTKIQYKINNQYKFMNTNIEAIVPKYSDVTNEYYISVYDEIKDADEITLIFNIRGNIYKYILK